MFHEDYIFILDDNIREIMQKERDKYSAYNEIILNHLIEYSSANINQQILLGGSHGLSYITDYTPDLSEITYHVYSNKALNHAFILSNKLEEYTADNEDYFVVMKSTIMNKIFDIYVNNIHMIRFYRVLLHDVDIKEIMGYEVDIKDKKLSVTNTDMYLMEIYSKLYNPKYVDEYNDLLIQEASIFNAMNIGTDIKDNKNKADADTYNKNPIELEILNKFIKNNNEIVLIGEHAIYMYHIVPYQIIKCITNKHFKYLIKELKNIFPKYEIDYKYSNVGLTIDDSLMRMSVKINNKEVIHVFNSAQYELIPYNIIHKNNDFIQVGSPFVIMKFMYIDLFILQILAEKNIINYSLYKTKKKNHDKIIYKFRQLLLNDITIYNSSNREITKKIIDYNKAEEIAPIFQKEQYIGIHKDEIIEQKIKLISGERVIDYYPKKYKLEQGTYKELPWL